ATKTTAISYLTVWPAGTSRPLASNLNFSAEQTIANLAVTALSSSGQVAVFNNHGQADVVIDVEGWISTPTGAVSSGRLTPIVPYRVADTRSGQGGTTLGPGGQLDLQVGGTGGAGGVPLSAEAVVLNVTAVNPTATGYLAVWPFGQPKPVISNVNFEPGQTIPNRIFVQVGSSGKVSIYNPSGSIDVVVDADAWVTDASAPAATTGLYTALYPVRILDTRVTPPALGPGGTRTIGVGGAYGIPSTASAVVLNVTAVGPTAGGFLTVWPSDAGRPATSDLNLTPGVTIPNLVVVKLSAGAGQVSIYNNAGTTNVVVDVEGYYN